VKYTKICKSCNKTQNYKAEDSFKLACKKNTVCKNCSSKKGVRRKSDCSFLLEESLLKYYWLGFIMADGHVSNNRLIIGLNKRDANYLEILADKLKTKVKLRKDVAIISAMHSDVFDKLVFKYKISRTKSTNPPDISSITGDNLIAFSIGFIDGDGCITNLHKRKDFQISIKVHASWLETLKYVFGKAYIQNSGYAITNISNTEDCKNLKKFLLKNDLPYLSRKWNKIDLNYVSRKVIAINRIQTTKQLLNQGKSRKEICEILGISDSGLSLLIKRNNLK